MLHKVEKAQLYWKPCFIKTVTYFLTCIPFCQPGVRSIPEHSCASACLGQQHLNGLLMRGMNMLSRVFDTWPARGHCQLTLTVRYYKLCLQTCTEKYHRLMRWQCSYRRFLRFFKSTFFRPFQKKSKEKKSLSEYCSLENTEQFKSICPITMEACQAGLETGQKLALNAVISAICF